MALPTPIDVALEHVIWLRLRNPQLEPQEAVAAFGPGVVVTTWAEVVRAFAAAWEALPEHIRREGNR